MLINKVIRLVKQQNKKQGSFRKIPLTDRELSWLSFNDRVLQEAYDPTVPLIERFRFMGIFSSNLDEFFRVRVASINRLVSLQGKSAALVDYKPQKILTQIKEVVVQQQQRFEFLYNNILLKELAENKIYIINEKQLNVSRGEFVREYFREKILPSLVPVMLDGRREFPALRDRANYLMIRLQLGASKAKYALVEIPSQLHSGFLILPSTKEMKYMIMMDDIIRYCLDELFSMFNFTQHDAYVIKMTRDAELNIDNDVSLDFIEKVSKSLKQRKKGLPVRLSYDANMPKEMLAVLMKKLTIIKESLVPGGRYQNFSGFMDMPNLGGPELEYSKNSFVPVKSLSGSRNLFSAIAEKDHLMVFPYQSFDHVIRFLRESAIDPHVRSIKMTIYRLAQNSRIINALINAARNGKKVTVIMEIQARFDEEANIYWAGRLQEEGVNVVHGIANRKVHAKMILVGRREGGKLKYYANLSTGNYNEKTASIYSDISFFTSTKQIINEVKKLFSFLEKNESGGVYKHLIVAPQHMRKGFIKLINQEIKHAKKGHNAYMILKMNNLVDDEIIDHLYKASKAGVIIKLIVRSTCCLIPGQKKISENIEALSIVDRYLEHARIFIFGNGGDEKCYISSADWMARNFDHRIEMAFPVYDVNLKKQIRDLLDIQLLDNTKARVITKKQKNAYRIIKSKVNHRSQVEIQQYLTKLNTK